MKHHIKLVYEDDGVLSPADDKFDMERIKVGDICVFTVPGNGEITCIASPDPDAVCANCAFDYSEYTCSGVDNFCCRYIDSQHPGLSYVPVGKILEDL
jgi:hypothetical protein